MKMRASFVALAVLALPAGCMPDVPEDPVPSKRAIAVFDVATSTIPLPNNAALEEDGTLPALPGTNDGSANGDFLNWFDALEGWSEATPITIPFAGALDESTVTTDSVRMFRFDSAGVTVAEIASVAVVDNDDQGSMCNPEVCDTVIVVTPAVTPEAGVGYAVIATKDIKGRNGVEVSESSALFFAASESPIVNADNEVLIGVLKDSPSTAQSLDALRVSLVPVFEAAKAAEIPRDRIASAQHWTVAKNPFTVLDPDSATIPIPNTLAIEEDGTFPSAALDFCGGPGVELAEIDTSCGADPPSWTTCDDGTDCDDAAASCVGGRCVYTNCAQGDFDTYLDGLHGWPTTTPITLPFAGDIDTATLNDQTVQVWEKTGDSARKVEGTSVGLSDCGDEIVIRMPGEMKYNAEYIAFATRGVTSTSGSSLLPPAAVALATIPNDPGEVVADCSATQAQTACDGAGVCAEIPNEGYKCVTSLVANVSDADAAAVMAIRPLLRPLVETVDAAAGIRWNELAGIWGWQTWTDTFVVFDPLAGNLPFPHLVLQSGCGDDEPVCLLPDAEGPTGEIIDELRKRQGFSSTAPHWIPTLGPPLDASTVTNAPQAEAGVLFAEADTIPPPLFPTDEWAVSYEFGNIVARFNRPLLPDTLVAGLTTTNLMGGNGFPAQPTPTFVLLRTEHPLIDEDGNKTVREIPDDATAAFLESSRDDFSDLFLVARLFGYDRSEINNAWAFTTGETHLPLQRLRARTVFEMAGGAPVATRGDDVLAPGPSITNPDGSATVDTSNIASIVWNLEFDSYNWLTEDYRLADAPSRSTLGATVFTPQAGCQAPYDVVIAQHGLGSYRNSFGLAVANELTSRCLAVVAIDMPLHGGRVQGPADLHPTTRPEDSGDGFVGSDFVGTVFRLQQAVIDQVVLVHMLEEGGFNTALGMNFSGPSSQIGYVGISMGAFAGTLLTTIEPKIGPTLLNVVGGDYGVILKESQTFNPILSAAGVEADTFTELQALHFIQWLGEHADPYAFAPYPVLNPLTEVLWDGAQYSDGDVLPPKDVLIQMATADTVVPNSATVAVARVMGVDISNTTFADTTHGFLNDLENDPPQRACGLTQAGEWISSSFSGSAALTTTVSDCGL